jgi:hypothetical protein
MELITTLYGHSIYLIATVAEAASTSHIGYMFFIATHST